MQWQWPPTLRSGKRLASMRPESQPFPRLAAAAARSEGTCIGCYLHPCALPCASAAMPLGSMRRAAAFHMLPNVRNPQWSGSSGIAEYLDFNTPAAVEFAECLASQHLAAAKFAACLVHNTRPWILESPDLFRVHALVMKLHLREGRISVQRDARSSASSRVWQACELEGTAGIHSPLCSRQWHHPYVRDFAFPPARPHVTV